MSLQSEGKLLYFKMFFFIFFFMLNILFSWAKLIYFILHHQLFVHPWLGLQHLLCCLYWDQDSNMHSYPYLRRTSNLLIILDNSIRKQLLYNYMHPLNCWQTKRWMGWTWPNLCLSLSLSISFSLFLQAGCTKTCIHISRCI